MQPIHEAAYDGDTYHVRRLVEEDPGRLNLVIEEEHIIPGLFVRKIDGPVDVDGCTPLALAAFAGRDETVRLLLEMGAAIPDDPDYGLSPAVWACFGRRASTLAMLLDAGASVEAKFYDMPLLSIAAIEGAVKCVKLLLARGADVNACDEDGGTALHCAAYDGHEKNCAASAPVGG